MTAFTAACIQLQSSTDVAENIATVERLVREAAAAGATYVQTPEMTNIVERKRPALFAAIAPEETDPAAKRFAALAAELGIVLHIGSLALKADEGHIANRALIFGESGALLGRYDKIHLFDVDLSDGTKIMESQTIEPGRETVVAEAPFGTLGLSVCYDLRFPELYRRLVDAGAMALAIPAAFTLTTGKDHWHVLLRARAIEQQCYVLAAAQTGHHYGERRSYGHALIADPWGTVIAQCGEEEGVAVAPIDPRFVDKVRRAVPSLAHRRIR